MSPPLRPRCRLRDQRPSCAEAKRAKLLLAVAAALTGAASLLPAAAAGRDRPSARLVYVRPNELAACPDEQAVRDAVASRLGYYPFDPRASRTVSARIRSGGAAGLRAEVELVGEAGKVTGVRRLSTPTGDCSELASAMELAISIAIDPMVVNRPEPAPPASPQAAPSSGRETTVMPPAPPPPPTASPTATTPTPPPTGAHGSPMAATVTAATTASTASPAALCVGVGLHGSMGSAPAATLGFTAQVGLRWTRSSIGLEARADLPASRSGGGGGAMATSATGSVEASLLLLSAVPCLHQGVMLGCALLSAGALAGSGTGVDQPRQDTTLYIAAGARLGVEVPLGGPIAGGLHVDLLATPTRTALRIDGRDRWVTPTVSAALGLGVVGTFP